MKRSNPITGRPYRKGHKRADGWVFNSYLDALDADGYYKELWLLPLQKEKKPRKLPKPHNAWRETLHGRMRALLANAKHHSKPRGHAPPDITVDDLLELWKDQRGLCAYTGWPLCVATGSDLVASLERKDNNIGYMKDNVLLVCWAVNNAKGTLTYEKFIQMCCAVVLTAQK